MPFHVDLLNLFGRMWTEVVFLTHPGVVLTAENEMLMLLRDVCVATLFTLLSF